jgi:Mor family transcriptional regulator
MVKLKKKENNIKTNEQTNLFSQMEGAQLTALTNYYSLQMHEIYMLCKKKTPTRRHMV